MIENEVCISDSIFPFLLERNGVNDDSHIVPVSEEWNLIVVNHWNEIPEDYSVTLTELSNGQKVDSWIYPYLQEIPFADIKNVIPHIQDSDMVELAGQVLGKLEAMSDEEFAEVVLEAAE